MLVKGATCVFVMEVLHYGVIMSMMASQITSLMIVYSAVYSGADQRKHQSLASLAFVWGIHRWLVNSPHKGPVTRKLFPFDDVVMVFWLQKNHPETPNDNQCWCHLFRVTCPRSQTTSQQRRHLLTTPITWIKYGLIGTGDYTDLLWWNDINN